MFLVHFTNFWGKKKFSGKLGLSRMSYGLLAPCQNFEKTNDAILRKRPDRRKDGQILFHRTIPPTAGDPRIYVKKKLKKIKIIINKNLVSTRNCSIETGLVKKFNSI